ncbi:MAG: peptidoglycan DD-metalloendopeptidase family protein [Clostridia bacterium]|nr:peptidoglycan DD-metalloendopeptidase family protein [Clostridia bacterium]
MNSANNLKRRAVTLFMTAVLCFFGIGEFLIKTNSAYAATDATVQALENKINAIKAQKKDVLNKINSAKEDRAEAIQYKSYIDQQLNLTQEEIDTINSLINELNTKISEKENEINTASSNIDEQYDNFKQIMRLTYEEGDASYIEMVLGAEDFYDFLVRMEQVSALMEYSSNLIESYRKNKIILEEAKTALEVSKASQVSYQNELDERQTELEAAQRENATYLSNISKNISSYTSSYEKFAAAEDALDKELEAYLRELQAKENAAYVGGEFRWPVPIKWTRISSQYGYRTLFGVREFHRGIDIPASGGEPIYASNGGKIITATYHSSYGNYVVVDHGGGKSTLYAHASKLNCKVGQTVKQGDIIAYVGTTGNSTGNHLHFEVRINGKHQNPLSYVTKP